MEWYSVLLLCWIAAAIGLLIGCICRAAGKADERAGLKEAERPHATGGIVKPGILVQEVSEFKPVVEAIKLKVVVNLEPLKAANSAIKLINMFYKSKKKKFRWKNYYKALKVMGRGADASKSRERSQYTEIN